jgi:hypothetical protein
MSDRRFASGAVYNGEYRMGKKHGKGTFIYSDGSKYIGKTNTCTNIGEFILKTT